MKSPLKSNKIVKYLILSDLAFWTGWGLLTPVFAIFIVGKIQGGSTLTVGISSAIYWITKSVLMIPIGMLLDSRPTEKDDYLALVCGILVASLVPFGYIFAKFPWHIYLLQGSYGAAMAFVFPGWLAIFSRHIDKGRESTQWCFESTAVGIGMGAAGVLGGWAVSRFGFDPVFIVVGILGLLGALLLLGLRKEIKAVPGHGLHFSIKDIFRPET